MLSVADHYRRDWAGSLAWARESAAVVTDDLTGESPRKAAQQLALALEYSGDLDGADEIHRDGLERSRAAGSRDDIAGHLLSMASIQLRRARQDQAAGYLEEAMNLYAEMGDRLMLVDCFRSAAVWVAPRAPEAALTLFGAAGALAEDFGFPLESDTSTLRFLAEPLAAARSQVGDARAGEAGERGASRPLASVLDFARDLLGQSVWASGSAPAAALTTREREIIDLVADGRTDREIAEKLFISLRTVRSHLDRIRDKTGCRRRADLTRLAIAAPDQL
jgi:non-specific serine/threonine protein kinase